MSDELQKSRDIKSMPRRRIRREIFLRQAKQPHRRIHPPSVLRVGRSRVLLLQVHKATCRLNQSLEIIRVVRFRSQPEMLEDVVRFIVALLIPTAKKTHVTGMIRNLVGCLFPRRAAQLRLMRPDIRPVPVRGNAGTRLAKVASGELDAVVLAYAGLARIGALEEVSEVFEPDAMIPKFASTEEIHVVVAGGTAGRFSVAIPGWLGTRNGSRPVTRPVE